MPASVPHIGRSPPRKEGRQKVTGQARYVDDLRPQVARLIHGVTVRSSVPRGRILGIRFLPGVPWEEITVVTAADIAAMGGHNYIALIGNDQPCLADGVISHNEEAVLLLGHPDRALVERARTLVQIDVEPLPALFDMDESLRLGHSGQQVIWGRDNTFKSFTIDKGDVGAALDAAPRTFVGDYETGAQEQLYIEPQGMLAEPTQDGGVIISGSLQCPYYIHQAIHQLLGLPKDKVRIVQCETGGGFGGKEEYPSMIAAHAVLLCRKAGCAAKIIYDRLEDMVATTKRHPSRTRIRTGWTPDGQLLAQDIDFRIDGGAYMTLSPVVLSRGALHAAGPYACDHVRVRARAAATNTPPQGAFRGFGAPQSVFAFERHLDDVAHALGITPSALRKKNLVRDGQTLSTGQVVRDGVDLRALLDRALVLSDFENKRAQHAAHNAQAAAAGSPLRRGIGLATFMHGAGFTGSGERYLASVVAVDCDPEGRVRVRASSTEIGQGKSTVFTQIACDVLGISSALIDIVTPDTNEVPNSGPTVASRTVMIVGRLVGDACQALLATLRASGCLSATEPVQDTTFLAAVVAYQQRHGVLRATAQYQQPTGIVWDDVTYRGDAYATYAWATYVAEVTVDLTTYETRVDDFVAVQEIGRVVHPVMAAGQIEGGVAQGVGFALYEKVVWKEGRMANGQMTNYIMPTSMDVPSIRVDFIEVPSPLGPGGAKGIGELPLDGTAPAILNAVFFAVGTPIRSIPMLPEDLLLALTQKACSPDRKDAGR